MKRLTQRSWIYISLAGFFLFALFFYLVITTEKKTTLDAPVYFFLVVFIDLVATGFLAGAMKSVATYQSSTPKGNLYLAGPVVVFCIILYIGYQYRPSEHKSLLSLSVQLSGPKGNQEPISKGTVSVIIDLFQQSRDVNNLGVAFFTGINPEFKGKPIELLVNVPGYYLPEENRYALGDSSDHTNLFVKLQKNKAATSFQGRLFSLPEKLGISGAVIHFSGTNVVVKTDSTGSFSTELPIASGSEVRIIAIKDNKEIYNSLRTIFQNDYLTLTENK